MLKGSIVRTRFVVVALAVVLLATTSFVVARYSASRGESSAIADPVRESDSTPGNAGIRTIDGQVVDTSQADWYVPFLEEDAKKERRDIVVAGITVGPTAHRAVTCGGDKVTAISPDSPDNHLRVNPTYLPEASVRQTAEATACEGDPAYWAVEYWIPPEEGVESRIRSGDVNFFDARHGAGFKIIRVAVSDPKTPSSIPVDRWEQTEIEGRPVAFGRPILGGLGDSIIADWDGRILTVIEGTWMPEEEMVRIAEGLR